MLQVKKGNQHTRKDAGWEKEWMILDNSAIEMKDIKVTKRDSLCVKNYIALSLFVVAVTIHL